MLLKPKNVIIFFLWVFLDYNMQFILLRVAPVIEMQSNSFYKNTQISTSLKGFLSVE